jgi:hypothetical protein
MSTARSMGQPTTERVVGQQNNDIIRLLVFLVVQFPGRISVRNARRPSATARQNSYLNSSQDIASNLAEKPIILLYDMPEAARR